MCHLNAVPEHCHRVLSSLHFLSLSYSFLLHTMVAYTDHAYANSDL